MSIIKPRTLSGFMELLPGKQIQFERMVSILRDTYSSYGFAPLDTPVIEDAQILLAKGGGETEKQIYRFQKGDSDLALRFDLTVPLAKYVALHCNDLAFPFRRFQISKVYRGERAQRGRFREFYQADIDIIGDGKLDKIGADKVRTLLVDTCGLTGEQADEILKFIAIRGTNAEVLAALEGYAGRNETFDMGLAELKAVCENLAAFGVPEANFAVDLTIARGLDYYTGTVYETTLLDHPEIGSVCSGGRYDNLAEYYTDRQLPGVGISIGLTRLFYVLGEQGLLNPALPTAPADVLILPMTEDLTAAIALATQLRGEGIRTQLYTEQKKFKAKMNYADNLGIPYVVFLGEDEIAAGVVACKDMVSGEQTKLGFDETLARIRQGLAEKNAGFVILEK